MIGDPLSAGAGAAISLTASVTADLTPDREPKAPGEGGAGRK